MPVFDNTADPSIFVIDPSAIARQPLEGATQPVVGQETLDRLAFLEWEAQAAAGVLEVLSHAEACDSLEQGSSVLVNEFQQLTGCKQVLLGLCAKGTTSFRLISASGPAAFDRAAAASRRLEAALAEVTLQKEALCWPPQMGSAGPTLLAHERLSSGSDGSQLISSPLRDAEGTVIGAWLFIGRRDFAHDPRYLGLIKACEPRVANCLRLLCRAERGPMARLLRWVQASSHRWRRRIILTGLVATMGCLFIPMHYHVECRCKIQPLVRRFVTAPFDGTLEKSLAEPGDIVAEGQTLARMDGRELRWESSGMEADRNRAAVKRNASLSKHEMGAARGAALEFQRLDLKLRVLQQRADHLDIKSPIRGVVVNGDLKRAEGMPVNVGQGLFEVAPLDHMIFELDVPEQEFAQVAVGQEVTVVLDAFPRKCWTGKIAKIYPRAEARESEEVFVAEVSVEKSDDALRPGMNGKATIIATRHIMAWILFHKPWQDLLMALGW
jgi:hypothetical protein